MSAYVQIFIVHIFGTKMLSALNEDGQFAYHFCLIL